MNKEDIRHLRAKLQRVEVASRELHENAKLLHENNVDTTQSTTLSDEQGELQDELEQLASDILAVLDTSDKISSDEGEYELPDPARNPLAKSQNSGLPEPRIPTRDTTDPAWVKRQD